MSRSAAAIVALCLTGVPALGPAQTIEERAARVREEMATPPPVETVIDRGTRVIGQPPAQSSGAASGGVDARLLSDGVQLTPDFSERMNRLMTGGVPSIRLDYRNPGGSAVVDDPRGTAHSGPLTGPGPTWVTGYAPGQLVIRRGSDNPQVGGTSNVTTGSGVPTASPNP